MATTGEENYLVRIDDLDGKFIGYLTVGAHMKPQKTHKDVIHMEKSRAERQARLINLYGKFKAKAVNRNGK